MCLVLACVCVCVCMYVCCWLIHYLIHLLSVCRWLDEGEDDGAIERDLELSKGNPFKVKVSTGKHKNASPGAQVVMVIYGDKGKSEEIPLGEDPKKNLKSGETEEYDVCSTPTSEATQS